MNNATVNMRYLRKFLVLITMLGIAGNGISFAQNQLKFSIADFDIDQFDTSARDRRYEKYDNSGDRYAIIKVTSTNPDDDLNLYNFNFGNMMHTVEEHNGVLWIYVQRNAKLVTITRPGYTPINKYDLHTTIEAGKNYVMTLTAEQKKIYKQIVQFNISPTDAHAVIMVKNILDGSQEKLLGYTDASGSVAKSMEYGTYTYRVLADSYHPEEGRFTLNNRAETLIENVTLRPNFSDITFSVDADADIYINGENMGKRQWSGQLLAGIYRVECRQENYKPTLEYIEVEEEDNRNINLTAPTPIIGTLTVTSSPLGADIYVDEEYKGNTPKSLDLIIGSHTINISKDGYHEETWTLDIEENKTMDLEIPLIEIGRTRIVTEPAEAKVYIDGMLAGITPYIYEGNGGEHKIKLQLDGYKTISQKVRFGDSDELKFTFVANSNTIKNQKKQAEMDEPQFGTVTVTSSPLGADVFIDSKYIGVTPLSVDLSPGKYALKLTKDRYNTEDRSLNIKNGKTTDFDIILKEEQNSDIIKTQQSKLMTFLKNNKGEEEPKSKSRIRNNHYHELGIYYNRTNFSFTEDGEYIDNNMPYMNGFAVKYLYGIGKRPAYVETGLTFNMNFGNETNKYEKVRSQYAALAIPVNFAFKFNIFNNTAIKLFAGINLKCNLLSRSHYSYYSSWYDNWYDKWYDNYNYDNSDYVKNWNRFQAGWHIGIDFSIKKFIVSLNYGTDFVPIWEYNDYYKLNTKTLNAGIGMYF